MAYEAAVLPTFPRGTGFSAVIALPTAKIFERPELPIAGPIGSDDSGGLHVPFTTLDMTKGSHGAD